MPSKATESRWTLKDLFTPKVKLATAATAEFRGELGKTDIAGKQFARTQSEDAAALLKQRAAMKESRRAVQDLGGMMNGMLPIFGIGFVAAVGKAVQSTMAFQSQMAQVGTLLNGTTAQVNARLGQLSTQVEQISRTTGQPLSDLTGGLYQVISALGDTAESAQILKIATMGATAGVSTTADSMDLLHSVMKGYGDESAAMAQKVSDLAFETVKLGVTTFPQLAGSMETVTSSAKLMGVSIQELFATQATLTGVIGDASMVSTDMEMALKALMKPSSAMQDALDKIGYKSGQAAIKALGFKGALTALVDSEHGNTAAIASMFGRVDGMKLALALAGTQSEIYDQKLKAMQNSAGATQRAFAAATNTLQFKWRLAVQDVTTSVINMVTKFHLLEGLSSVLGVFTKHFQVIGPVLAGLTVTFGSLLTVMAAAKAATLAQTVVLGAFRTVTTESTIATEGAKVAMEGMNATFRLSPLGIVATSLGVVAMAAMWVGNHMESTKFAWMESWNAITKVTQSAVNVGIDIVNEYARAYKFEFDAIKYAGISIWDGIIKAAQAGANALLKIMSPFSGILKHIGINIPSSVNFSGALGTATAPKWDSSFGLKHVNFTGAMYNPGEVSAQRTKAQAEWNQTMTQNTQALKEHTKALTDHKNSVNSNTDATKANTSATNSNTASSKSSSMSGEEIANKLMPRLERHLYGTTTA